MTQEKCLHDIANITMVFPNWTPTLQSCLPGWHYRIVQERHHDQDCLVVWIVQSSQDGQEKGLELFRSPIYEAASDHLKLRVAHLEYVLSAGLHEKLLDSDQQIEQLRRDLKAAQTKLEAGQAVQDLNNRRWRELTDQREEALNRWEWAEGQINLLKAQVERLTAAQAPKL